MNEVARVGTSCFALSTKFVSIWVFIGLFRYQDACFSIQMNTFVKAISSYLLYFRVISI
jgi:hypothetical protein